MMKLSSYLSRIGFTGAPRPDLATLQALHTAHARSIPFENLDVQLRRGVTTDVEAAFDKLVLRERGGWCFEMNGVFGWALEQIGFQVMRVAGGVMREVRGDQQLGNHLCLLVTIDRPYLADVGFGGSLAGPLPLALGERDDAPYRIRLTQSADGFWRFTEIAHSEPFGFDFRADPADEARLVAQCTHLQTAPDSSFVQNLVVQRREDATHIGLRGRVLAVTTAAGVTKTLLHSADELVRVLREQFGLIAPEAADLWSLICRRHAALFGDVETGETA
jgi:N-hydroxyarylamine O-acetyltransferase